MHRYICKELILTFCVRKFHSFLFCVLFLLIFFFYFKHFAKMFTSARFMSLHKVSAILWFFRLYFFSVQHEMIGSNSNNNNNGIRSGEYCCERITTKKFLSSLQRSPIPTRVMKTFHFSFWHFLEYFEAFWNSILCICF